jgi:hypothetical protein
MPVNRGVNARAPRTIEVVLALLAAAALAGCAETRLYSGRPPGDVAAGLDQRWHSAYFLGTTDNGRPYKLDNVCPRGWSEIVVSQDTFTALMSVATLFLYTPSRVTVVCAAEPHVSRAEERLHRYPPAPSDTDD